MKTLEDLMMNLLQTVVVGVSAGTTGSCGLYLSFSAPFPALVANGVTGCFANDPYMFKVSIWMKTYITLQVEV
jgi:hypothetical protein